MNEQLVLFPTSEEEDLLLNQSQRFRTLASEGQALVKGYVRACRESGGQPSKQGWFKASGLARSTAYEIAKRDAVPIYAAIREAMQVACQEGAQFGAMALVAGGIRIYEDLVSKRRSTRDLTSVELSIMRDCAALMGMMPHSTAAGASASFSMVDPGTGKRMDVSLGVGQAPAGEAGALSAMLSKLRERQRQTAEASGNQAAAESVQAEGVAAGEADFDPAAPAEKSPAAADLAAKGPAESPAAGQVALETAPAAGAPA